jgi:plastocyanin
MALRFCVVLVCAVTLASCKSSNTPAAPSPTTATISIVSGARTMTTTAYSPNPVTITRGSTITWVNNDTTTHDQVADGGTFDTRDVAPGAQASVTFQNSGTFPYHCGRHPGMVGTINVQ